MSEGVAYFLRRNAYRFAATGIVGIALSGCADATRFADSGSPFANPFASAGAAPTPQVAATPLAQANPYNQHYATSARPSPSAVASSAPPTSEATGAIRPQSVGGSAKGWTAVGGSPIVVGAQDDAAALSARYGVPEAALLNANGLRAGSQLHAGMRIVVPVYNANGPTGVVKAEEERSDERTPRRVARRDDQDDATRTAHEDRVKSRKSDVAERSDKKTAEADRPKKADKPSAKAEPRTEVAAAEPAKPTKKADTDKTPIGNVAPSSATTADENGQFRWPARGRIIQGYKTGGNEGINIALPEGTSVRAAEDGEVAYAGNMLKGYGNMVLIRHSNGFISAYANNGELDVKKGDKVKRGQVIAKSGQTGDVSTPQLHFELRKGNNPVDPTSYLAGL